MFRGLATIGAMLLVLSASPAVAAPAQADWAGSRARFIEHRRIRNTYVYRHEYTRVAELQYANAETARFRRTAEARAATIAGLRGDLSRLAATDRRSRQRVIQLQREIELLEDEMASAVESLTAELARQSEEYRRNRQILITAAQQLLETQEGRQALELIALGGRENRAAAAGIVDLLYRERQAVARARAAIDARSAAVTMLDLRGDGIATTARIIELFQDVVANDPSNPWDWMTLSDLYRDANDLANATIAADHAAATASSDLTRSYALTTQGDVLRSMAGNDELVSGLADSSATIETLLRAVQAQGVPSDPIQLMRRVVTVFEPLLATMVDRPEETQALRLYRAALEISRRRLRESPDAPDRQEDVALHATKVAWTLASLGEADRYARVGEWVRALKGLLDANVAMDRLRTSLIEGIQIMTAPPRSAEILSLNRESHDIMRRLYAVQPTSVSRRRNLAVSHLALGHLYQTRQEYDESLTNFEEATTLLRPLAGAAGADEGTRVDFATSLFALAAELRRRNRHEEARGHLEQALGILEAAAAADPGSASRQRHLGYALARLAETNVPGFTWARALAHFERMQERSMLTPGDEAFLATARLLARAPRQP